MTHGDESPWVPRSAEEAADVMESCARYLAGRDCAGTATETLARVITAMERVDAGQAAVRAKAIGEFTPSARVCAGRAPGNAGLAGLPDWC